jgi:hypothetical protein
MQIFKWQEERLYGSEFCGYGNRLHFYEEKTIKAKNRISNNRHDRVKKPSGQLQPD